MVRTAVPTSKYEDGAILQANYRIKCGKCSQECCPICTNISKITFLHFAEQVAGRRLFRRWANGLDGRPMMVTTGSCSDGFGYFEPILEPLTRMLKVAGSLWRAYPAQETLDVAVIAIHEDPYITHCGDIYCERCRDAVLGGPILIRIMDHGRGSHWLRVGSKKCSPLHLY